MEMLAHWGAAEVAGQQGTNLPIDQALHPQVQAFKATALQARNALQVQEVLNNNQWQDVERFYMDVIGQFKERNQEQLKQQRPGMSPEERMELARQLEPIVFDPNMVADVRQQLVKIDNELKKVGASVWTHPKTARIAKVINIDTEPGRPGYLASGEQEERIDYGAYAGGNLGAVGRGIGYLATEVSYPVLSGFTEVAGNLAVGAYELGADAVAGLSAGNIQVPRASSVIEGPDGKIYYNGSKVSGHDVYGTMYALVTEQGVEETVARLNGQDHYETLKRSGFTDVVRGTSHMLGTLAGYLTPGAVAMGAGAKAGSALTQSLTMKGMGNLAAGHGINATRAARITGVLGSTSGAAVGNGILESVAYGRLEGYGSAFVHGSAMGGVMMGLGAMGRGAERLLRTRAKMPRKAAELTAAALEGAGFGVVEMAQGAEFFSGEGELWRFLREPSEETWDDFFHVMAKNVGAMVIFKGLHGRTPGEVAQEARLSGRKPAEVLEARQQAEALQERVDTRIERAKVFAGKPTTVVRGEAAEVGRRMTEAKRAAEEVLGRPLEGGVHAQVRSIGRRQARFEAGQRVHEALRTQRKVAREETRVKQELAEVGRALRERGEIEKFIEQRGVEPSEQGERMLGGKIVGQAKDMATVRNPREVPDRMMSFVQRRAGREEVAMGEFLTVAARGAEGDVVMAVTRGEAQKVKGADILTTAREALERAGYPEGEALIDAAGRVPFTHNHPVELHPSTPDIAAHIAYKIGTAPGERSADIVVTPRGAWVMRYEGAQEYRSRPEVPSEVTIANRRKHAKALAERVANAREELFSFQWTAAEKALFRKYERGERFDNARDRARAKKLYEQMEQHFAAAAREIGVRMDFLTPGEYRLAWRRFEETGQFRAVKEPFPEEAREMAEAPREKAEQTAVKQELREEGVPITGDAEKAAKVVTEQRQAREEALVRGDRPAEVLETEFTARVRQAAPETPRFGKFGQDRALLGETFDAIREESGLTRPKFKDHILNEVRRGNLELETADPVPSELRSRGWKFRDEAGKEHTFHFVRVVERNPPAKPEAPVEPAKPEVVNRPTPEGWKPSKFAEEPPVTPEVESAARAFMQATAPGALPGIEKQRARAQQVREEASPLADIARAPGAGEGSRALRPGAEQVEPIKQSDVVREMQGFEGDPVRVPVRRRGFDREQIESYIDLRENLIGTNEAHDLTALAHEWAHAMQRATVGLKWEPWTPRISAELNSLLEFMPEGKRSRLSREKRVQEGWAEFWARELLADPNLETKAPEMYREGMRWLASQPALVGQFGRVKDALGRWFRQREQDRVRQTFVAVDQKPSPQEKREAGGFWRQAVRWFDRNFLNEASEMIRLEKEALRIEGIDPGGVPVTQSMSKMFETLRGTSRGTAENFLYRFTFDFGVPDRKGISLRQALSEVKLKEREDFITYLMARHGIEMHNRGMRMPLSRQTYETTVAELGNRRFEEAAAGMQRWNNALISYLEQAGAITESAGAVLRDGWTVNSLFMRQITKGISKHGTEILEARDPLEALVQVTHNIISRAHRAAVVRAGIEQNLRYPGMGRFLSIIDRPRQVDPRSRESIAEALERAGWAPGMHEGMVDALQNLGVQHRADMTSIINLFGEVGAEGKRPRTTAVPRFTEAQIAAEPSPQIRAKMNAINGRLLHVEYDPRVFQALKSIDPTHGWSSQTLRWLVGVPTEVARKGLTTFSLGFVMRNMIRDATLYPMFTDKKTRARFLPIVGGIFDMVRGARSEAAEKFQALGGRGSTFFGEQRARATSQLFAETGGEKGVRFIRHPVQALRQLAGEMERRLSATESFLRSREFEKVRDRELKAGKAEIEANLAALYAGKDLIDYTRAGTVARAINRVVPFFTASMAGHRKFLRATLGFDGRAKQLQALAIGAQIGAVSAVIYSMFGEEEWYQDLPQWKKMGYWNFRIGDQVMSIPKPFEAGKMFTVPVEMALEQTHGTRSVETEEFLVDTVMGYLHGLNFVPTVIGPSLEVRSNYDFFRGQEIVPQWMTRKDPAEQTFRRTSWMARWIGGNFNLSPILVEHWIDKHSGGLGLDVMRGVDDIRRWGGLEAPRTTSEELRSIPGISTFFSSRHRSSRSVNELYERANELQAKTSKTGAEKALLRRLRSARSQISNIRNLQRKGRLTREEADRKAYEIARPLTGR